MFLINQDIHHLMPPIIKSIYTPCLDPSACNFSFKLDKLTCFERESIFYGTDVYKDVSAAIVRYNEAVTKK